MERSIPSSSFREQDPLYLMDHPDNEDGLVGVDRFPVNDNSVLSSLTVGSNSHVLSNGRVELDSCPNVDLGVNNFSVDLAEGMAANSSHSSLVSPENEADSMLQPEKGKAQLIESKQSLLSSQPLDAKHLYTVDNKVKGGPLNGMAVDIQSSVSVERNTDADIQNIQNSIDLPLDTNDGICSPNLSASQLMWNKSRIGNSCSSASASHSPGWIDRKQDFLRSGFGNGPKKPRTQVSYSLPFGGQDYNSKNKFHQSKGFSHKRIRRASEKKTSEAFGTSQKNLELCSCEANVLVIVGDRGWREYGARFILV